MTLPEDADEAPAEPRSSRRTQEIIADLSAAATELISRIVKAERDVHDQRNAAFRAMNQAALVADDATRLRTALGTARQLIEAAWSDCSSETLKEDLGRGLALIDEVLTETGDLHDV